MTEISVTNPTLDLIRTSQEETEQQFPLWIASRTDVLVANLREKLLSSETVELNFGDLRERLRQVDYEALQRLEGLLNDLAADRLGVVGARLALMVRRGDLAFIDAIDTLPAPGSEAYSRMLRALLEAPSSHLYSTLKDRGLRLDVTEMASIINSSKIPLGQLAAFGLEDEEFKYLLADLAPQLTYTDLRGLDGPTQKDTLDRCNPELLRHLFIRTDKVETLPKNMAQLQSLDCSFCTQLSALPSGMEQLQILDCSSCKQLSSLPRSMGQLQRLNCGSCEQLNTLPAGMGQLRSLNCKGCKELSALPTGMEQLQDLDCSFCEQLSALPSDIGQLQRLNCSFCQRLSALPTNMGRLLSLDCSFCDRLSALPEDMGRLQCLDCRGCKQLSALPTNMGQLQRLTCRHCEHLRALPEDMGQLQSLDCSSCRELSALPSSLPQCTYLNFRGCPRLAHTPTPEVPASAEVYRTVGGVDRGSGNWSVKIHQVQQRPKEFMMELGAKWLLKGRPFPSILYLEEDGTPSLAIDVGGVRRDLITRILDSLFLKNNEVTTGEHKNHLFVTPTGMPTCEENDGTGVAAFKSLARIMALCYQDVCHLKTGPLFPLSLYQALLAQSPEEMAVPIKGLQQGILSLLTLPLPEHISEEVFQEAYVLLEEGEVEALDARTAKDLLDYLKANDEGQKTLSRVLLQTAEAPELASTRTAIKHLTEEMKKALGRKLWMQIQAEGPKALQERVEGVLSKKALLDHMDWTWDPRFTSGSAAQRIKTFLQKWVDEAPHDMLELFVRMVTGNKTLSPKRLKMELYDRGPCYIPIAHTCFFSMELSNAYSDQESFVHFLNLSLDHGCAGSGFQFG